MSAYCRVCGSKMIGDGVETPLHCEREAGGHAPDAPLKKCPECGGRVKKSMGDDRYVPIHDYCTKCAWTSVPISRH